MTGHDDRPGVTSAMYDRYALRTAGAHAAFVLPHLKSGMTLLDIGCGLGSITLGLAEAVALGRVVGIDTNEDALARSEASAKERGVGNIGFMVGSAYDLPFGASSFDAVFSHMVLMHLDDPVRVARQAYRVVKTGGLFGVADRAEQGDIRGNSNETIERAWDIFMKWQEARGSDLRLGAQLRAILRQGGFHAVSAAASYHGSTLEEYILQFGTFFASDSLTSQALERGWADQRDLNDIRSAIQTWGSHPDTFWDMARVDAIGWKR